MIMSKNTLQRYLKLRYHSTYPSSSVMAILYPSVVNSCRYLQLKTEIRNVCVAATTAKPLMFELLGSSRYFEALNHVFVDLLVVNQTETRFWAPLLFLQCPRSAFHAIWATAENGPAVTAWLNSGVLPGFLEGGRKSVWCSSLEPHT
jgi:hypothetical protein